MPRHRVLALLILFSVVLTGCSSASEESEPTPSNVQNLIQPTPTCSTDEFTGGSDWIKGQLKAFGNTDPEKAYSFASDEFRAANTIQDFAAVIVSQYSMLLDLKEYQVLSCEKSADLFTFQVKLTDNQESTYSMEYVLSLNNNQWGVEGASISLKVE
jgi:hypothetical protein